MNIRKLIRFAAPLVLLVAAGCLDREAPTSPPDAPLLSEDECSLGISDADALAELASLIARVDALEAAGALNKGQARALRNHLQNARRHLQEGRRCPALAQLGAFREQVGNFVADGVLTSAQAQPLLEGIGHVIDGPPPVVIEATISVGVWHTCGLTASGTAYCWGRNSEGQLGDGTNANRHVPTPVAAPHGVSFVSISASWFHTCALAVGGGAYCWGSGSYEQVGDGTNVPTAVTLPPGVSFTAIAASDYHNCGLTPAGSAYCWGENDFGQLGDGTTTDRPIPTAVAAPPDVSFTAIATGLLHTCGLTSAGSAYCWGRNTNGELGDGDETLWTGYNPNPRQHLKRLTPTAVDAPPGVSFAAIGTAGSHTCGLTPDGTAYCWGFNWTSQIGAGDSPSLFIYVRPTPVAAPSGVTISQIAPGSNHTCALTAAGSAYCWGLWDPTLNGGEHALPTLVEAPLGLSFVRIYAGGETCALTTAGNAYCWGRNNFGQLGDGTTTNRHVPTTVAGWTELQ